MQLFVDAADLCGAGRRHLLAALGQFVVAVGPRVYPFAVHQAFLVHDVDPGHGHGGVGARLHLQHYLRAGAKPRHARVDADELRAELAHHFDDGVAIHAVRVGAKGFLAPQHHDLGRHEFVMLVPVGELLGVVDFGIAAAQHERRVGNARTITRPTGLGVHRVRGAEDQVGPLGVPVVRLAAGAAEDRDGLGAVLLDDLVGGVRHQVGGLVPRAAFPLVKPAVFLRALHGMDDAVRMVDVLGQSQASRAQRALGDRVFRIALHLRHHAVLHMHLKPTSHRMASRRGPGTGPEDGLFPLLPLPLAHRYLLVLVSLAYAGSRRSREPAVKYACARRNEGETRNVLPSPMRGRPSN